MNKKFFVGVILACIVVSAMLPVCQVQVSAQETKANVQNQKTIIIKDSLGREIEVPYPVERMAFLNLFAVPALVALNATDQIVGIEQATKWVLECYPSLKDGVLKGKLKFTKDSQVPALIEDWMNKPAIGMVMGTPPDYEKIIELNPQVVLSYADPLWYYPELDDHKGLKRAGIKVVRLDCYKPETYAEEVETLGRMLGKDEEAKELVNFFESYAKKTEKKVKDMDLPAEEKVRVYSEAGLPYFAYGKNSGPNQVIKRAGGINIGENVKGSMFQFPGFGGGTEYPLVDPEWVADNNPQVIISSPIGPSVMTLANLSWGEFMEIAGDYTRTREMPALFVPLITDYINDPMLYKMRDEIMNRDEKLKGTDAVKSGRVYVSAIEHFCWPAAVGFEANWFYPDDIKVSREKWLKKLYGAEYKGGFDKLLVYPCS